MLNVVQMREAPLLNDIPSQLRQLADAIENGDHDKVEACYAIIPVAGDYPKVFGWGNLYDNYNPIVVMQLAMAYFVNNVVSR